MSLPAADASAHRTRFRAGAVCGLLSAALFGASAPLAKRLLDGAGPVMLASLLYLGSGLGLSAFRLFRPASGDTQRLRREDWPLMLTVIASGGVAGPVLLLWGLARTGGLLGSLLLNLEGPFTMLLAVALFGERLSSAEVAASALVLAGAGIMSMPSGSAAAYLHSDPLGGVAIATACLAWGLDNNVTRQLSVRDPVRIVQVKTLVAGVTNGCLAFAIGQHVAAAGTLLPAFAVGAICYGASIVLDVYALRFLGAAREAAFFSAAPFVGALLAMPLLHEMPRAVDIAGATLMLAGVTWLVRRGLRPPRRRRRGDATGCD